MSTAVGGRRPDGARLLVVGGGRCDPAAARVKRLVKQWQAASEDYTVPRDHWDSLGGTQDKGGPISLMRRVLDKAGIDCTEPGEFRFRGAWCRVQRSQCLAILVAGVCAGLALETLCPPARYH